MVLNRYRDAALREAQSLLPQGEAWTRDPRSTFARLLNALGLGVAAPQQRAADLIEETDPRTAVELLTQWERVLGLPDDCLPNPTGLEQRRALVTSRVVGEGGGSIAWFKALAAAIGYEIEIEEGSSNPTRIGATCGDELIGAGNDFVWTIRAPLGQVQRAVCGEARVGDRIESFGDQLLECVMRRAAPAHTLLTFAYSNGLYVLVLIDSDGTSYLIQSTAGGMPVEDTDGSSYLLPIEDGGLRVTDVDGSTYRIPLQEA